MTRPLISIKSYKAFGKINVKFTCHYVNFTLHLSGRYLKACTMTLMNNLKTMRFNKNQITQEELAGKVSVSR